MAKDRTQYFLIHEPFDDTLRFTDGFYRISSKIECRKCGHSFMQTLKCDRFRSPIGITLHARKPDPSDEKVMSSFFIKSHDHGIGNPRLHERGCPVAKMPMAKHILASMGTCGRA